MKTARSIVDELGRKDVALRLGVSLKSVSRTAAENSFPASWWLVLSKLCEDRGIACPPTLFAFKFSEETIQFGTLA